MCRNCRNSDIDEVSEVEPEPIVGDENLSENGRNEVGISDELYHFHKIVQQLVGIVCVSQFPNIKKKNVRSCSD
jgi:hypothetical protein